MPPLPGNPQKIGIASPDRAWEKSVRLRGKRSRAGADTGDALPFSVAKSIISHDPTQRQLVQLKEETHADEQVGFGASDALRPTLAGFRAARRHGSRLLSCGVAQRLQNGRSDGQRSSAVTGKLPAHDKGGAIKIAGGERGLVFFRHFFCG